MKTAAITVAVLSFWLFAGFILAIVIGRALGEPVQPEGDEQHPRRSDANSLGREEQRRVVVAHGEPAPTNKGQHHA